LTHSPTHGGEARQRVISSPVGAYAFPFSLARAMRNINAMKAALATSHARMAPCFAGVELRILDENTDLRAAEAVSTHGWHPLAWGRELMRHDVAVLLCAGIDHATWSAIQGHGIQVIPNAIGDPETVLEGWRSGRLSPPAVWPNYPVGFGAGGLRAGRRRRFRGGRGH
jgi:hypothetical protein